jgi:hypothetical protein
MKQTEQPPALHRGAVTELVAAGRVIAARMNVRQRSDLEDALQLGAILTKLKEAWKEEVGLYTAGLEKMGISRQRAHEYLRLHEGHTSGTDVSSCEGIQSALEKIKAAEGEAKAGTRSPAQIRKEIAERQKAAATRAQQDSCEKDSFGNPIPKHCLDAWKDPGVREARANLEIIEDVLRKARLIDVVAKRATAYPFIDAKEFGHGIGQAMNDLEKCLDHLRDNLPEGVCPSCKGQRCNHCLNSGLVPRNVYEALKKEKVSS